MKMSRVVGVLAASAALTGVLAEAQTPASQGASGMNPTQEIAKETPEGPALVAGPTEIRIGGYLGVTGVYRSTAGGGGIGSNFATIPYGDTADGNLSEFRLSAQASRLSIRVNAAPAPDQAALAGYFEMDFNGSVPGNAAVTSNSVGFRLRNAFGEGHFHGRFLVAAGQAFTLMTPVKGQLSVWPSDYELTQAVDTNYVAGKVWGRVPQVRFTYRPSTSFNWALSIENPEQQIGSGIVTLPSCCASDLAAQYNTGSNGLDVANAMPDILSRVGFNKGKLLHVDAGGVLREFRHSLQPYDATQRHAGGGVSVNARLMPSSTTVVLGEFAYGPGLGRYIGGLAPDVSISADGQIHPIRTGSWVAGVEQQLTAHASAAIYDSGVHSDKSYSVDAGGADIGFGYPGAPNSANKSIHEITGVFAWQAWRIEGRGSMQWTTQLSWVSRTPWSAGSGPSSADTLMVLSQLRYNLP
jgi:hypothetical protein